MAGPWEDYGPAPSAATAKKQTPAKKAQPRQYSKDAALSALRKSDAVMNEGLKNLTAPQRKKALATYYGSPTIQRLRQNAGLPAVRTREEELQSIAAAEFKKSSTRPVVVRRGASKDAGFFTRRRQATPEEKRQLAGVSEGRTARVNNQTGLEQSYINAFGRAMFGLPERVIAAFDNTPGTRNYDERLKVRRKVTDMQRGRNIVGNVGGTVGGAVTSSAGAAGTIRLAGRGVAALPGGQAVGNFIQRLTQLEAGQRGRNAVKIVASGAAGGGAQSAGEGSDIATGTITGAIAAPLVVAGIKGGEWATRPLRDFLRMSGAKGILQRYTSATAEELSERAAAFRQRTGTEPTVYELLPEADRVGIRDLLRKAPGASRERATGLVRQRVGNMPRELSDRTAEITAPQQRYMARELARELAGSRGATNPTADELALAQRAVRDPTELEMVRRSVDRNIMAPFDNQRAYGSVDELIPTNPVRQGSTIRQEVSDPEVANAIRSVAGTRRMAPEGFTVRDISDMVSDLRKDVGKGGIEGRAAQRAINHLDDILQRDFPDVADAMGRMSQAHAARSRMMEGVPEGRATRLREDVPVSGARQANQVRNVYDTPEGAGGRAMGQRAQLMSDFEGTPNRAIARAGEIAESPGTQEAIRRNLGARAGDEIGEMAEAQSESLRRLGSLRNTPKGEDGDVDFGDLAMSMSLLSPTALLRTKSQAVTTILRLLQGIPEGRANQLVDALFSQNPAQMANAMRLLNSAGEQGSRAARDIIGSILAGRGAASVVNSVDEQRAETGGLDMVDDGTEAPADEGEEAGPWDAYGANPETGGVPYGRAVVEALFPGAVVTEDVRDPNSALGRANPGSYHNSTDGAVDVRPIPGMTFEEFVSRLQDEGYEIVEAIDEVNHPSKHATGPHWHVVLA